MDEDDIPSENFMKVRDQSLKNYLAPFEYMRGNFFSRTFDARIKKFLYFYFSEIVCYFANWAGIY
jgi:hypothetical protein